MNRSRTVHAALVAAGAAATVLLADPTPVSMTVGGSLLGAGALLWIAASCGDPALPPHQRGGLYRHVRNPAALAGLVLAAGLVLFAASEEPRGRWVPRTVAPLGLLFFFVEALPRADAEVRARARREGGEDGSRWVQHVPSLVPCLRPWRGDPQDGRAVRRFGTALVVPALAGLAALLCVLRRGWVDALGF